MQTNSEEPLPESSWNSTIYVEKTYTTTSTLNYTFLMTDLNEQCRIPVMCIATNPYGRSEQYFALSFNSSENNCFQTSASETFSDSTVIIALTVLIVIICLVYISY